MFESVGSVDWVETVELVDSVEGRDPVEVLFLFPIKDSRRFCAALGLFSFVIDAGL